MKIFAARFLRPSVFCRGTEKPLMKVCVPLGACFGARLRSGKKTKNTYFCLDLSIFTFFFSF